MKRITLSKLKPGMESVITGLLAKGGMRRRLQDLGFVEGSHVDCVGISPLGNPTAYRISGTIIALRSEDANQILIQEVETDV